MSTPTPRASRLLKVADVAERLSLSPSKIYDLIESRSISHNKIGGAIRISEEQLAEFLHETQRERGGTGRSTQKHRRARLKHIKL